MGTEIETDRRRDQKTERTRDGCDVRRDQLLGTVGMYHSWLQWVIMCLVSDSTESLKNRLVEHLISDRINMA